MTGDDPDPAASAGGSAARASIGDRAAAALGPLVRLILQHCALARAEFAASGAGLGAASLLAIVAVPLALIALTLLLVGAALALALVMPIWASFLCVGAATMAAAGLLLLLARARSRYCSLVPRRALASLRKQLAELGEQWL